MDSTDQYFTYESRLASFQSAQPLAKRRASNASTKGPKSLKWPHKFLSGEELARAGFFFAPLLSNPDNVRCFLCQKSLDGWEEGDDPAAEHLKHNPDCGWAIVTAIEKSDGELSEEYPMSERMMEARRATFAERWPHENKKGWKCKTKQMVDAGWKYTPTPESDDMATCAYCALALDGWEKGDKPIDEHHKRSVQCPFFALITKQSQSPKRTKSKRERASKASRLSNQSNLQDVTMMSEAPSNADLPAEEDDSILTTATNATAKRATRAKKATAPKGRKTRAKKEEPVEVAEDPEPEDADFEVKVDIQQPKAGKKRKSPEPEPEVDAPAPKRRNTRTRSSTIMDDSTMLDAEVPQPKGKGKKSGRISRKVSAASVASLRGPVPNDEEIERALEADLERPLSDDEGQKPKASKKSKNANHSMFGVEPMDIDEAAIDAELDAMEVESKPIPKAKGGKAAQPRKVSAKQRAAAKKAAQAEEKAQQLAEEERIAEEERLAEQEASEQINAELEQSVSMQHSSPIIQPKRQRASSRQAPRPLPPIPTRGSAIPVVDEPMVEANDESGNETDASQSTIVRGRTSRRGSTLKKGKGGKKGPSRNIEEIVHKSQEELPNPLKGKMHLHIEEVSITEERFYTPAPEPVPVQEPVPRAVKAKATKGKGRPAKKNSGSIEEAVAQASVHEDTPEPIQAAPKSPTPPPKDLTPAVSPQSSDAENQPPSSKPSAASQRAVSTPKTSTKRIPLADTTPILSPSKRNILAGLQTDQAWTAVDLDMIFLKSPTGNGTDLFGNAEQKLKQGDLTSPEKKMSVEEWIHYNAQQAEERLRNECERMVSNFETQGTRAMRALEGLECVE